MDRIEPAHGAGFGARRIGIASRDVSRSALVDQALARLGAVLPLDPGDAADWRTEVAVWWADADDALRMPPPSGRQFVVVVPLSEIDAWGELLGRPDVELVIDDDPEAIVRAAARRQRRAEQRAREQGGGDTARRLQELSLEVGRIAEALGVLGGAASVADGRSGYRADAREGPPVTAAQIRELIRARRVREGFFSPGLFADPAWDMLLDLMAARLERREVAVSSLCIAAAVPPTTALRWIGMMTDEGLLVRVADPADRRRVFLRLSDDAAARMEGCLRAIVPALGAVA